MRPGIIPRFCKVHGSLILTILGGISFVGTVVLTAVISPKVCKKMERQLNEKKLNEFDRLRNKIEEDNGRNITYEESDEIAFEIDKIQLTGSEKAEIAIPFYIPVILLGSAGLACFIGAHVMNMKRQAALISAYITLEQGFMAYRDEIRNEYGVEADRKALMDSRKKILELEKDKKNLEKLKGVQFYSFSTQPGIVFKATPHRIEQAFLHFNWNLFDTPYPDCRSIDELYNFVGVSSYEKNDEIYGWNEYENSISWGQRFIGYRLIDTKTKDEVSVHIIDFLIPPYDITIDGYGEGESSCNHISPSYQPAVCANMIAEKSSTDSDILSIDPEWECIRVQPF